MTQQIQTTVAVCAFVVGILLATDTPLHASEPADAAAIKQQLEGLQKQNAELLEQLRQQSLLIQDLTQRVARVESTSANQREVLDDLQASVEEKDDAPRSGINLGNFNISGEGAVAFFDSQANGQFPNNEFRVDEARLFIEAPIWGDVYFFSELNLATREEEELDLKLGELYLDWEDISQLWGQSRLLNARIGRFDIPFGEEYLYRDAIDNPLISHSLPDFWGIDEGIELYGSAGNFSYVLAVQNGGVPGTRDFTSDKSITGRVSFDPTEWLHLSVSAMRTGDLDATDDSVSELWIGGGWFRSIGSTNTTEFHANLVQGDVALNFSRGHVRLFGGFAQYDDNDPFANNRRDFCYYSIEGMFQVTKKFYAAARFGQMFTDSGYPLPGNGDLGTYFFNPFAPHVEDIWRCSLGVGYRFSRNFVVKTEYTLEQAGYAGGGERDHVNLFATQAAFGF